MTKIKLCGMQKIEDIDAVNEIMPDYVGYVFAGSSRRYITMEKAKELTARLKKTIIPVGVFVNEKPELIGECCEKQIIRAVQLHGTENHDYIRYLKTLTKCELIQAVSIRSEAALKRAMESNADYILLDSGAGSGQVFDWNRIRNVNRPYFLAGGLNGENVVSAIKELSPYGVDASSFLEKNGCKDKDKMAAFVKAVRKEEKQDE